MGKRKRLVVVIIIAVALVIMVPIVIMVSTGLLLANEKEFIKDELDNKIINENYDNWKGANVSGGYKFMIPEEWSITEESGILQITDSKEIVAYGASIGTPESLFSNRKGFMSAITEKENLDIVQNYVPGFVQIRGSNFGEMVISSDTGEMIYHYLTLASPTVGDSAEFFMVFPNETSFEFEYLFESAQAIVFSYCFPSEE